MVLTLKCDNNDIRADMPLTSSPQERLLGICKIHFDLWDAQNEWFIPKAPVSFLESHHEKSLGSGMTRNEKVMNYEQAWQWVLGRLQIEMPRAAFDTWVRDTQALALADGTLTVGVRNAYARDWLRIVLPARSTVCWWVS